MLTFNEMYDGMECMVRFFDHAMGRTMERKVDFNDVDCILKDSAEVLFYVAKVGMDINIIDERSAKTLCVVINESEDGDIVVDVKTVIDERYRHPKRNNLVIQKDGSIVLSGLLTGCMPEWL